DSSRTSVCPPPRCLVGPQVSPRSPGSRACKSLGVSEVSDYAGLGRNSVTFTMLLSEYGERMHWGCAIPNIEYDPGDGNPIVLRIDCLNSALCGALKRCDGRKTDLTFRLEAKRLDVCAGVAARLLDRLQVMKPWHCYVSSVSTFLVHEIQERFS